MIVLDEQLLGRGIEHDIARWYQGKVQFIIDIRPHTVIKDNAIPMLLRQQSRPTFVTMNARDFWQRVPGDPRYCEEEDAHIWVSLPLTLPAEEREELANRMAEKSLDLLLAEGLLIMVGVEEPL